MEIELNRLDLMHAGQCDPGTLALFSQSKNKQQKIIIGDKQGTVQCFGVKKTEVIGVFKSLPVNQTITSLTSGHGQAQKDKAYIAADQTVRGMNKKGKEFFRFVTNLTEKITKVVVEDNEMWIAGEFNYNYYIDCKDKSFYMSPDRINDLLLANVTSPGTQNAVLGCQDRCIRVLDGDSVYYDVAINGPVTTVQGSEARDTALGAVLKKEKEILYGTSNGLLGQVLYEPDSIRRGWVIEAEKQGAGVSAMSTATDFTGDGVPDIVVGRSNGALEVWGMDEAYEPRKVLSKDLNETVQTVESGYICTPEAHDVICQTFSGKVVALTNTASVYEAPQVPTSSGMQTQSKESQLTGLKGDIDSLKKQLESEKELAQNLSLEAPVVAGNILEVRHAFQLDETSSGKYVLTLEAAVPLFGAVIQADVPVHLVEEQGTAIVSHSPPDIAGGSMCLASYRCQESSNRVEIHMEVVEGQYGTLQTFLIPAAPPKTCNTVTCRLKPLCLHTRIEQLPDEDTIPMNELKVTGTFEISDIHAWIAFALPEVSDRAPIQSTAELRFKSSLLGTCLVCRYAAGEATFLSDSPTALAILREALTREANSAKVRVSITFQFNSGSVGHFMGLLWPQLVEQRDLAKRVQVMEALQELKMQDGGDVSYLSPQQQEDLKHADKLRQELAGQPRRLEYLTGVVKDLFIDWCKFNGSSAASHKRMPDLDRMLNDPEVVERAEVVSFILST